MTNRLTFDAAALLFFYASPSIATARRYVKLSTAVVVPSRHNNAGLPTLHVPQLSLNLLRSELPKSVRVYEINGPMFFGMADRISCITLKHFTKYLIIRMRGVPSLDAKGMNALETLYRYCDESGVRLIFSRVNGQPMKTMGRAGFVDLIGEENLRANIDDAIARATELIEAEEAQGEEPVKA